MYTIYGQYRDKEPEELDTTDNEEEAYYRLQQYRMAFGTDWLIYIEER